VKLHEVYQVVHDKYTKYIMYNKKTPPVNVFSKQAVETEISKLKNQIRLFEACKQLKVPLALADSEGATVKLDAEGGTGELWLWVDRSYFNLNVADYDKLIESANHWLALWIDRLNELEGEIPEELTSIFGGDKK